MISLEAAANGEHVFIVGASNTGSTVLYRLLAYHPDLAWFSQWSNRDGTIPGRPSFPLSRTIDRLGRKLVAHPWSKNTNVGPLGRLYQSVVPRPGDGGDSWVSIFPLINHKDGASLIRIAEGDLPIYAQDDVPRLRDRLIGLVHRELASQGKSRFLAKRPPLCFAAPALAEVFPNARFIHTLRDGKACVVTRAYRRAHGKHDLEWVRLAAKEWQETMRFIAQVQKDIGPERWIDVRYEDYCEDVRGEVTRLLDFCDLPRDQAMLAALPAEIRSTNKKRLAEVPEEYRREIAAIAGEQLETWGYASL